MLLRVRLREIRAELSAARSGLRLSATGIAVALAVGAVWLAGHLGFQLGAAPMFGVPELEDASGGLAAGVRLLINAPMEVFRAGLDDPTRLVMGFFALALPAALLPISILLGPTSEDAPRRAMRQFGNAMATLSMVMAALTVIWIASPFRGARLTPMPSDVAAASTWLAGRSTVAGLDALAATTSVLWGVLLLRLDIARWLRRLAGTFVIGAASAMLVAAAISNGAAADLERSRAAIRAAGDGAGAATAGEAALLGQALRGSALLRRVGNTNFVEFQPELRGAALGRTTVRRLLAAPGPQAGS